MDEAITAAITLVSILGLALGAMCWTVAIVGGRIARAIEAQRPDPDWVAVEKQLTMNDVGTREVRIKEIKAGPEGQVRTWR